MNSSHTLTVLLAVSITVAAAAARSGTESAVPATPTQASQASANSFPSDIYPETGNRFPVIKRESLDDAGKKLYDARGVADGFGPGAIRLYSPAVADSMTSVNDYLRRKSGLEPRLVELAILVTAREMDCAYVWTAHEPAAVKAGLSQQIIDAVRYRRPLGTVGEREAVIVQLGRDSITKHKVASDTFARAVKLFGHRGVVDIMSLMGDYAATTILLNAADQHVRPRDKSLLPIP
jgi:4-carboxymuconolactone decarboxylase